MFGLSSEPTALAVVCGVAPCRDLGTLRGRRATTPKRSRRRSGLVERRSPSHRSRCSMLSGSNERRGSATRWAAAWSGASRRSHPSASMRSSTSRRALASLPNRAPTTSRSCFVPLHQVETTRSRGPSTCCAGRWAATSTKRQRRSTPRPSWMTSAGVASRSHISPPGSSGRRGFTGDAPDEHRMLVIYGDEDSMAVGGRAFASAHPAATAVELPGYGHWFPEPGPWPTITAAILDIAGHRVVAPPTTRVPAS